MMVFKMAAASATVTLAILALFYGVTAIPVPHLTPRVLTVGFLTGVLLLSVLVEAAMRLCDAHRAGK